MSKRMTKHTLDERIQAVLCVIENNKPTNVIARKYNAEGIDGLKEAKQWKRYSEDLKNQDVEYYLDGKASLKRTCEKFNISDPSVLRQWIKLYTSGKEIKSTSKGREPMTKGRKTTLKERLEIAQYTIANDFNYHEATEKYEVSYQQVYNWVRKYQQGGEQSFEDRRGKALESKTTLTEEERLQLRIKELNHRNQYLEAENGLLKKLKEIERRKEMRD